MKACDTHPTGLQVYKILTYIYCLVVANKTAKIHALCQNANKFMSFIPTNMNSLEKKGLKRQTCNEYHNLQ